MGYKQGTPDGVLYVGNVKWSNDYKNVMRFGSKSARNTFMTTNLTRIEANEIHYNPNNYIDVHEKLENVETWNYAYYKNDSDISTTPYFCFITNYEYVAPNCTRLYVELDVFQMYYYDTTFYQSYIERAIIAKSADVYGANTLPEPISANIEHFNELTDTATNPLTANDYSPRWVLHKASHYNETSGEYEYGGNGTKNTFGEYGVYIPNITVMNEEINTYGRQSLGGALKQIERNVDNNTTGQWTAAGKNFVKNIVAAVLTGDFTQIQNYNESIGLTAVSNGLSLAQFQDHRDELIGLYAVPKWVIDNVDSGANLRNLDNDNVEKNLKFTISNTKIATGTSDEYTPRNKKLLTSICRAYVLANKNGVKIPFKPELFTSNNVTFTLRGIAMATNGYQYYTNQYEDITVGHGEIVYNSERRVGYDANTGLNKTLNALSATQNVIGAGVSVGANVAMGNYGGAVLGVGGLVEAGVSAIDRIGTREEHFGSNGDILRTLGKFAQLHFYEMYPKIDQIQAIDNFFDMYGYTISKHLNPNSFMANRSKWNYLKTNNINLRAAAPADYENKLKSIFNDGVTLWHNYASFGDYTQSNT